MELFFRKKFINNAYLKIISNRSTHTTYYFCKGNAKFWKSPLPPKEI